MEDVIIKGENDINICPITYCYETFSHQFGFDDLMLVIGRELDAVQTLDPNDITRTRCQRSYPRFTFIFVHWEEGKMWQPSLFGCSVIAEENTHLHTSTADTFTPERMSSHTSLDSRPRA